MQLVWFYRLNPFRLFHRKISKIESTLMDSIYSTVEWNGESKESPLGDNFINGLFTSKPTPSMHSCRFNNSKDTFPKALMDPSRQKN